MFEKMSIIRVRKAIAVGFLFLFFCIYTKDRYRQILPKPTFIYMLQVLLVIHYL